MRCAVRAHFIVLAAVFAASTAHAQSGIDLPSRTIARVLVSGGIGGRFARPICQHGRDLEPSPTALYTYALMRESRSLDHPMVLDSGGLLTPHGVARFAALNDPHALARLVEAIGYRVLAFGEEELGAPRDTLMDVLRALRIRGIPSVATNLRCVDEAIPLCDLLVDASDGPSMHDVDGQRMAVLGFLAESATSSVAPDLAGGIEIAAPSDALPAAVELARREGADIVVAVVSGSASDALELARDLPVSGRPDLMVLAGAGDLLFARPATVVPPIASPPPGDAVEILLREGLLRDGLEMVVQPLGGGGVDVAGPVLDFIDRIGYDYCDEWGRPLAGGHLSTEERLPASELALLTARIMRAAGDADVSILNRGAIDQGWMQAQRSVLTSSDLYVALPYDEPLMVADVPASWLSQLAPRAETADLLTPGLEAGSPVKILGRPIQSRATYRVVTLRFLATGGDHALPDLPDGSEWRPMEGTLRSIILDRLSARDARDPRRAISDRSEEPEWIFQAMADGTFSGSSISNPSTYDSPLLNRTDTVTLGLEVNLRADATAPVWTWENQGLFRYRTQWAPSLMDGTAGEFQEAVDQIQIQSLGAWTGLRHDITEWYVPEFFVEVFLESEFNEPASRSWHWLLFRPTAGARFPIADVLDVRFSAGVQSQLLADSRVDFGLGANATLREWELAKVDDRLITISALVDYFLLNIFVENRWQFRSSFDASFALVGPLALTFGFRLYMQDGNVNPGTTLTTSREVAVAVDALAGLRMGWLGREVGP